MYIENKNQKKSLGLIWLECLRDVLMNGERIFDENVPLLEIRNYYITIMDANEQDSILQKYADQKRIALMKEKYTSCNILAGYNLSYGRLLFDNNGVDQIEWVINRLNTKPETKSATIVMHIPGENDLSCLSMLDFKLRNGLLDMSVIYRSQNVFASQPGNFIALSQIHSSIANRLCVKQGIIEGIILSAHIYEKDVPLTKAILKEYDNTI